LPRRSHAGVRLAGGLPFVFPTISLHERFSFRPRCCWRNLMSMDVEEMLTRCRSIRSC